MSQHDKRAEILRDFPRIPKHHLSLLMERMTRYGNTTALVAAYVRHTLTNYDQTLARVQVAYYGGHWSDARFNIDAKVSSTLQTWKGAQ